MPAAYPIGTVRPMKRWGKCIDMVKVTHHGPPHRRWVPRHRLQSGIPIAAEQRVFHDQAENPFVGKPIDNLRRMLAANPKLEAKRRRRQSRAVSKRNISRARVDRSLRIQMGKFYPVVHAKLTVIFLPFRTKHQAEIVGGRPEYAGMVIEAMRGSQLESLVGYEREIPDDGQSWVQKRTQDKMKVKGASDEHIAGEARATSEGGASEADVSIGAGIETQARADDLVSHRR